MAVIPHSLPQVTSTHKDAHIVIEEDSTRIERTVLPGGIRVITQKVPATRSVSLGMWFAVGSRDEHTGHYGSTHYLEHLLFKGTKRFSAVDIARAFDAVGGETNAATGKEYTHYYARVLADDVPMATEILMDMVTSPLLSERDFATERTVILEELAMSADDPSDVAYENYASQVFDGQDLGRPVGGTKETVLATPREAVIEHHRRAYGSSTLVVAASGAVEHHQLCDLIMRQVQTNGWDTDPDALPRDVRAGDELQITPASTRVVERPVTQSHVLVGCRSIPAPDERRPALSMLMTILGGGMSSRLFQEVREKRGLAYTTYAFDSVYSDSGAFAMYAGCAPHNADEVAKVMVGELENIANGDVTEAEMEQVLGQIRGSFVLDLEHNGVRMSRLGRSEIVRAKFYTVDQVVQRFNEVSADDIIDVAQLLLSRPRIHTTVRPVGAGEA